MSEIIIKPLSDWTDCEQCGGGCEDGGQVFIDGVVVFEYIPSAGCFGNTSVDREALLVEALKALGHTIVIQETDLIGEYDE